MVLVNYTVQGRPQTIGQASREGGEQRRQQMQTSVIIETDHESSVPSSKTLSLWNVSNGTYETPCFSPSLLLQNLVMVVPHPLSATECAAL
ncbi:hypothetical protein NC651_018630 [Populus alba x Populus x berolinensis]|nr:hypothetical protein NC651_018630 [Populus alba x Populus x berolinensis]